MGRPAAQAARAGGFLQVAVLPGRLPAAARHRGGYRIVKKPVLPKELEPYQESLDRMTAATIHDEMARATVRDELWALTQLFWPHAELTAKVTSLEGQWYASSPRSFHSRSARSRGTPSHPGGARRWGTGCTATTSWASGMSTPGCTTATCSSTISTRRPGGWSAGPYLCARPCRGPKSMWPRAAPGSPACAVHASARADMLRMA